MTSENDNDDRNQKDLGYGEALNELEEILEQLEDADIDIDLLATKVKRGAELVRHCKQRLEVVTDDVNKVVEELTVSQD